MSKASNAINAKYYEDLLEREGLGVVEVDTPYQGLNFGHIKGKWARLDAMINKLPKQDGNRKHPSYMTNSPLTARGTDDVEHESRPINFDDVAMRGDSAWENFIVSLTATPKEAELADRERATVCGLDPWGRPRSLKPKRMHRELPRDYRKRVQRHILGEVAMGPGPAYSKYQPTPPPYAHSDAGNGPLSIVDLPEPEYQWSPSCEANWSLEPDDSNEVVTRPDEVRMSPIVDTMHYPSGRGPYQMSRIMQSNSDITG